MRALRPYILTLAAICTAILVVAARSYVPAESNRIHLIPGSNQHSSTSANVEFRSGELSDLCLPYNSLQSIKIPTERCRTLKENNLHYATLSAFTVSQSLFGVNRSDIVECCSRFAVRGMEYYIYNLRRIII